MPVWMADFRRETPDVRDMRRMLQSRTFTLQYDTADLLRARGAALKQAYLAACSQLCRIPQGRVADAIRHELTEARDLRDRRAVPAAAIA
jgi:hypothetical protein